MVSVRIDGVPIIGAFSWPMTVGVAPAIAKATVAPWEVDRLLATGRSKRNSQTLTIEPWPGQTIRWSGLTVIENAPASNDHEGAVLIVDRRYWWTFPLVYREVNISRRTGTVRRAAWDQPLVTDPGKRELDYAKFSTFQRSGTPWTARQLLEGVLEYVDGAPPVFDDQMPELPLQDLVLRGNGQQAIAQLLRQITGAELTVDNRGRVRVFDFASGRERGLVGTGSIPRPGAAGHELIGGGHVALVERAATRPRYVEVCFDIESELRFDFIGDAASEVDEVAPADTTSAADGEQRSPQRTPRYIQNVMPIPDHELANPGGGPSDAAGTVLPIFRYLERIRALARPGIAPALTFDIINRAMIPFQAHLWASLNLAGTYLAADATADWSARLAAIQAHYRSTWQLPRDWMDRIRSLRPYLVATVDTNRGTRSPARVYSDHCIVHSTKALFLPRTDGQRGLAYAMNVPGWPGTGTTPSEITSSHKPTPATLQVLDEDLGLLYINHQIDPYGNAQVILPSYMLDIPEGDKRPVNRTGPVYFNSVAKGSTTYPRLSPNHRVAVLLTAVPANSLFAERITFEEARAALPRAAKDTAGATGPPMRVYCTRETARVQWSQAAAPAIEKAFGMGGEDSWDVAAASNDLRPYVVNAAETKAGAASLRQLARETAARIYAGLLDRVEGTAEYAPSEMVPIGAIERTEIAVDDEGAVTSSIRLRGQLPELDLRSFLDAGTQKVLMRLVK